MKISYVTNCHNRLWQLKQTLDHNLKFTKSSEVELCILAYNDDETYDFLIKHYIDYIKDGRLKVSKHHDNYKPFDGSDYACGYVKHLAHQMATGKIVFNLDADNFICNAHEHLLQLQPNEILNNAPFLPDGRNGRIGVYRSVYNRVGGYKDKGRYDDGVFISDCLRLGGMKLKSIDCNIKPIANNPNSI